MCLCKFVLILGIVYSVMASPKKYVSKNIQHGVLDSVIRECLASNTRLSCLSEKAAVAVERSMNWDIPLYEGVKFIRNEEKLTNRSGKALTGFSRLANAVSNFLETHSFSIDLTESGRVIAGNTAREGGGESGGDGGGGGGEGGGIFNLDKKALKKEKKYYQYAFMVLLGIFGLIGPLVMKTLGVLAAHALLASKAALIIVGGVALKKIFENDGPTKPVVKVHTIPSHESHEEHDYDRIGYSYNYVPMRYSSFASTSSSQPYSAYSSDDFAPILYGTHYSDQASKTR